MSCDRAGIIPSPEQIDTMCGLFQEAIALDAYLADPYWDLAVIHARFLHQVMLHPCHRQSVIEYHLN